MFSLKKILLPVDFSDRSSAVAPYAKAFASQFQSQLVLLHVEESPPYLRGLRTIAHPTGRAEYIKQLKSELSSLFSSEFEGLAVTQDLVEGDPATRIVEYVHANQVDLIMMPTRGFGPYRQFLLGSITAKVLHDSDCPVWTTTHIEEALPVQPVSYQKIACAVDLGTHRTNSLLDLEPGFRVGRTIPGDSCHGST